MGLTRVCVISKEGNGYASMYAASVERVFSIHASIVAVHLHFEDS